MNSILVKKETLT